MGERWCVKVRHDGRDLVMWLFRSEFGARECAAEVNRQYGTDAYFVEEWVPGG